MTQAPRRNGTPSSLGLSREDLALKVAKAELALTHNGTGGSLNFSDSGLDADGVKAIMGALANSSTLSRLDLSHNALGCEVGDTIKAALGRDSALTRLDLSHSMLGVDLRYSGFGNLRIAFASVLVACVGVPLGLLLCVGCADPDPGSQSPERQPGEPGRRRAGCCGLGCLILLAAYVFFSLCPFRDDAGAAVGQALRHNTALTHLDLSRNALGNEAGRAIGRALEHNAALTHLNLSHNALGDKAGRAIAEALEHSSTLTHLDLSHNSLGTEVDEAQRLRTRGRPAAAPFRASVACCLFAIWLLFSASTCGRCIAPIACLVVVVVNPEVVGLDLRKNDAAGHAIGQALKDNAALTYLDLSNNVFSEEAGKAIGQALEQNSALTCLDLSDNVLGTEADEAFASALQLNRALTTLSGDLPEAHDALEVNSREEKDGEIARLQAKLSERGSRVTLSGERIGAGRMNLILRGLKADLGINILEMSNVSLLPMARVALAKALMNNSNLTSLDLSHNELSDETGKTIGQALEHNTALAHLDLSHNALGAKAGRAIGQALERNAALTHLNLSHNGIDGKAGRALAAALRVNERLASLDVRSNRLGDVGGLELTWALACNSALARLDPQGNLMGRDVEDRIAQLMQADRSQSNCQRSNQSLRSLHIDGEVHGNNAASEILSICGWAPKTWRDKVWLLPDTVGTLTSITHWRWELRMANPGPFLPDKFDLGRDATRNRRVYWLTSLAVVYFVTILLGTAILKGRDVISISRRGYKRLQLRSAEEAFPPLTDCQLRWWSFAVFLMHFIIILLAVWASMQSGRISQVSGLDWEIYFSLFVLSCAWTLCQAVWTACIAPRNAEYAWSAFAVATLPACIPYMSDAVDTLLDAIVGALCLLLPFPWCALGYMSLTWLVIAHYYFFQHDNTMYELSNTYLSVRLAPTKGNTELSKWETLVLALYKMTTPTKRYVMAVEDVPQMIIVAVYSFLRIQLRAADISLLMWVGKVAIPIFRLGFAYVMYPILLPEVASWVAKELREAYDTNLEMKLRLQMQLLEGEEDKTLLSGVIRRDPELALRIDGLADLVAPGLSKALHRAGDVLDLRGIPLDDVVAPIVVELLRINGGITEIDCSDGFAITSDEVRAAIRNSLKVNRTLAEHVTGETAIGPKLKASSKELQVTSVDLSGMSLSEQELKAIALVVMELDSITTCDGVTEANRKAIEGSLAVNRILAKHTYFADRNLGQVLKGSGPNEKVLELGDIQLNDIVAPIIVDFLKLKDNITVIDKGFAAMAPDRYEGMAIRNSLKVNCALARHVTAETAIGPELKASSGELQVTSVDLSGMSLSEQELKAIAMVVRKVPSIIRLDVSRSDHWVGKEALKDELRHAWNSSRDGQEAGLLLESQAQGPEPQKRQAQGCWLM